MIEELGIIRRIGTDQFQMIGITTVVIVAVVVAVVVVVTSKNEVWSILCFKTKNGREGKGGGRNGEKRVLRSRYGYG